MVTGSIPEGCTNICSVWFHNLSLKTNQKFVQQWNEWKTTNREVYNVIKDNFNKSKPKDIVYFPITLNNVNLVLETL